MRDMHFQVLWVHWLNMLLGLWLVFSPWAFGVFDAQAFSDAVAQVTADRELVPPPRSSASRGWDGAILPAAV